MQTTKAFKIFDIALLQSVLLYIILAIILFPHYQTQLNPDGISYMSIAQKYVLHDYSDAINGYWGPLISWLMVPFFSIGLRPLVAANLVLLIIGLFVIVQSYSLIKTLNINLLFRFVGINIISVVVIYFAFRAIAPDLLFVSFSLALINKILDNTFNNSKYAGVLYGLIGSGLYLTKSFGFLFFIASFFIVSLVFYLRAENLSARRRIVINYISGMIIFLFISGCWIYLLSYKYGQFTIGTAENYNRALTDTNATGHPMYYAGLLDPPNGTAISIWEDVSHLNLKGWSIFDSFDTMIYELKIIAKNIFSILNYLNEFSLLSIPFLIIAFTYLINKGRRFVCENIFYLLLLVFILFSGYAMIAVDPRYLWFGNIVTIIVGSKLLNLLFDNVIFKKISKIILIGFFISGFLIFPAKSIFATLDNGKTLFELSNRIAKLNVNGRIASIGDWETSLYISFYNGWQYYGRSGNFEESYLENELKNKKIDYYLVWDTYKNKIKFIDKYKEITEGKIGGLRIYKMK